MSFTQQYCDAQQALRVFRSALSWEISERDPPPERIALLKEFDVEAVKLSTGMSNDHDATRAVDWVKRTRKDLFGRTW